MKSTLFSIGAFAGLAAANITFQWVNPTCEFSALDASQCLTGQHCTERNT
jgi:hypothetical protein